MHIEYKINVITRKLHECDENIDWSYVVHDITNIYWLYNALLRAFL